MKMVLASDKRKGFTLVELIVVIVILAILIGVSIGGLYSWVGESRKSVARNNSEAIEKQLSTIVVDDEFDKLRKCYSYFHVAFLFTSKYKYVYNESYEYNGNKIYFNETDLENNKTIDHVGIFKEVYSDLNDGISHDDAVDLDYMMYFIYKVCGCIPYPDFTKDCGYLIEFLFNGSNGIKNEEFLVRVTPVYNLRKSDGNMEKYIGNIMDKSVNYGHEYFTANNGYSRRKSIIIADKYKFLDD